MDLLTTEQAATELGVTTTRIRQLILAGELEAEKAGRDWLIEREALESVRERRRPGRPRK
jgi:excisionase family DNA binding protein